MTDPSPARWTDESVLIGILATTLTNHPLPWNIVRDSMYEVKAKDGVIIAKFPEEAMAGRLITFAEEYQQESAAAAAQIKLMFETGDRGAGSMSLNAVA